MRTATRTAGLIAGTTMLMAASVGPAWSGQLISYEGEQQTGERAQARVVKRDSGRRFVRSMGFANVTLVCEDATENTIGLGFGFGGRDSPGVRVDGGRVLDREYKNTTLFFEDVPQLFVRVTGTFRWADADGTLIFSIGALTQDGSDSQLCTSGELTWSMLRSGVSPARVTASSMPEGVGFAKFRLNADGELELARFVQP